MGRLKTHGWLMLIIAITALYGGLTFRVLPPEVFFSGDEALKFWQVRIFVQHGCTKIAADDYPGESLDPTRQYFPMPENYFVTRDARLFLPFPLIFSLLATPPYLLLGAKGLYLWPVIAGGLTIWATYRLGRAILPRVAVPALLILGLGTPVLFYSLTFWEHVPATALTTWALVLLLREDGGRRLRTAGCAGLLFGGAIWFRSEVYLFMLVAVGLYWLFFRPPWRVMGAWVGGILACLLPLWLMQWTFYGNPLGLHISNYVGRYELQPSPQLFTPFSWDKFFQDKVMVAYVSLVRGTQEWSNDAIVVGIFVGLVFLLRFTRRRYGSLLIVLATLALVVVDWPNAQVNKDVLHGLIPTFPLTAIVLAYTPSKQPLALWSRREKIVAFLFFTGFGFVGLTALTMLHNPGWEWGPRFLLPMFPLLVIVALDNLERWLGAADLSACRQIAVAASFVILVGLGVALQAAGVVYMAEFKQRPLNVLHRLEAFPTPYVVTDSGWYSQEVVAVYYEKKLFRVTDQTALEDLIRRFFHHGVEQFGVAFEGLYSLEPQVETADYRVVAETNGVYRIVSKTAGDGP